MVKLLTATEAIAIDDALAESYKLLADIGLDSDDLYFIIEARTILKKLKETTIEEILGDEDEPT